MILKKCDHNQILQQIDEATNKKTKSRTEAMDMKTNIITHKPLVKTEGRRPRQQSMQKTTASRRDWVDLLKKP